MMNADLKKGAVIFHYTSKQEIANEEQDNWVDDMKKTIEYSNLPITVEVLPHDPSQLDSYFG